MVESQNAGPWNRRTRAHRLTTVRSWDELPKDMTEAEEDEFWRTHELGDELLDRAGPLPADVCAAIDQIRRRRAGQPTGPAL